MILLKSTFCSKDFRKVGIMRSCANLAAQMGFMILLIFVIADRFNSPFAYANALTNTLCVALYFIILDIIFYSVLLYGLAQRRPSILLAWLCFAPTEIILVQVTLMWCIYLVASLASFAYGIFTIIGHILITTYMFHNTCVILSARHEFINQPQLPSGVVHYVPPIAGPAGKVAANPPIPQYMYVAPVPNNGGYMHNAPQYQQTNAQQSSYLR